MKRRRTPSYDIGLASDAGGQTQRVCAGVPGGVHDAGARRPSGRGARYRDGARAALRSTSAARKTRMIYSAFEKKIAEAMGVQNIEEDVKGMLPTFL